MAAQTALESDWAYVFSRLHEVFHEFGVSRTLTRLNSYRDRCAHFFTKTKEFCDSFQAQLNRCQPPGPRSVSGHAHSVFFHVLLRLINYPNPLFPFEFFNGASVVGEFVSPALREREKVQGPFSDAAIRAARLRAERASRSVKLMLSPAAAAKSMEKMEG